MIRRILGACSALAFAAPTPSVAQGFNLDCGEAFGTPSETYGAAAGQPGYWNQFVGNTTNPFPLRDPSGDLTKTRLLQSLPFGSASFPHPEVLGDERALLCDYLDLGSTPHAFVLTGIEPGLYDLWVYGWAPDASFFLTSVFLDEDHLAVLGGRWPGGLVQDVTHAVFRVTIGPEVDLAINTFGFGSPFGNGTLNGMQLSKVQLFLAMELDGGAPFSLPAGRATPLVVRIDPRDELIARPPQLVWRFASGSGAFTRVPLVALGGELWTAELPAGACGQVVEYFVSTAGSASGHRTLPNGAPEALFRAPVGTHGIEPRLSADFEAGLPDEWSADGLWHVTSACAPAPSCDGGAFAYFGIDGQCDYDAGFEAKGALSTPLVDLATKLENARATLRFCYEKEGMDEFLGTASVWVEGTLVAELPHQPFEWAEAEIDLTKFLGQAVTIEFRFDANHPAAGNARGFFVDGVSVVVEGTTCGDAHEGLPQLGVGAEALLK